MRDARRHLEKKSTHLTSPDTDQGEDVTQAFLFLKKIQ